MNHILAAIAAAEAVLAGFIRDISSHGRRRRDLKREISTSVTPHPVR
nr:hypothetical protein [Bradyrhizobium sp. ORS 278]